MPRSFDFLADFPATVEQVHSAFGDRDYWQARLATFGAGTGTATLDSLAVDKDGTVTVAATFGLLRERLPRVVSQLGRGDLHMVHKETWSVLGQGRVRGEVSLAVPGTPVSALGKALVMAAKNGSQMNYTVTVQVKVPLVGGKIESFMAGQLAEGVSEIQRFTTEWIAANG